MNPSRSLLLVLSFPLLGTVLAAAQTTTNVTWNITLIPTADTAERISVIGTTGSAGPLGNATLRLSGVGPISNNTVVAPLAADGRVVLQ